MRKDLHSIEQRIHFTISSVKATKLPTYAIKQALGEPVQWTFYGKSSSQVYRKFTVSDVYSGRGKPSVCQVERLHSDALNSQVPLSDLEQLRISISNLLGSRIEVVNKIRPTKQGAEATRKELANDESINGY